MSDTKIEWADKSWNPVTGCTPVSEGCEHCYGARMAKRLKGRFGYPAADPFKVTLHPDRLDEPLHWKKPRRIFVCSMGDLFHRDVSFEFCDDVFATFQQATWHTYLILTKRPERLRRYLEPWIRDLGQEEMYSRLRHVWLGVSVENQQTADERIPILLQIPAAVRFVSIEPMLGSVDIRPYLWHCEPEIERVAVTRDMAIDAGDLALVGSQFNIEHEPEWYPRDQLHWVIVGGESGPGARPMEIEWARDIRDQCEAVGVPLFYKQGPGDGGYYGKMPVLDGRTHDEFPEK